MNFWQGPRHQERAAPGAPAMTVLPVVVGHLEQHVVPDDAGVVHEAPTGGPSSVRDPLEAALATGRPESDTSSPTAAPDHRRRDPLSGLLSGRLPQVDPATAMPSAGQL
jgi:hypothetical protein